MEDPNKLIERINNADRRQRRITYLLQAFGGALLTLIAVANIFALLQLHTLITEHYQRTQEINGNFSKQFSQIEAALKAQDAYFGCRIALVDNGASSPSTLQTCIAPFGNTTPTKASSNTTSSSAQPTTADDLAVVTEPSRSSSSPSSTSTTPSSPSAPTASPQPVAPTPLQPATQLLQGAQSNLDRLVNNLPLI